MGEVTIRRQLGEVTENFDRLLVHLATLLARTRPRTKIASTKLGKIRKDLSDPERLDSQSMASLMEIVSKYNAINDLFEGGLIFEDRDVAKIVEGSASYEDDSQQGYNDKFFELSMGVRFWRGIQKIKPEVRVALDGICDVIVDDEIAIECKYAHSAGRLVDNVKKARKQIDCRVSKGSARYGFIALDISNLVSKGGGFNWSMQQLR